MENKALITFEKELAGLSQTLAPLPWAYAKNNLGYVLVVLGQKESDLALFEKSIAEMEGVLETSDPKEDLEGWISLQMTYAAALHAFGQRGTEETVSLLNKSMEAYKKILPVLKRQEAPLEWALMMHNIAMVFQDLGEHSEGSRTLERSITAYNNALTQRSANVVPLQWALSQNNAAVSLQVLGQLQNDENILKDALVSYGNLGSVRTILAEKIQDAEMAGQAVKNFTEVANFLAEAKNSAYLKVVEQFSAKAEAVLKTTS